MQLEMPRPVPCFEGSLAKLRPLIPEADAKGYYELCLEPETHLWTGNSVLASEEEARFELERFAAIKTVSMWMILDKPSGRIAGRFFVCLEERNGLRVAGEGNRIAKEFWRKGHNKEARALLFRYVFDELRADLIETEAWKGNENSVKSIESYGFKLLGEDMRWNEKHGAALPLRRYSLSKEKWQARLTEK